VRAHSDVCTPSHPPVFTVCLISYPSKLGPKVHFSKGVTLYKSPPEPTLQTFLTLKSTGHIKCLNHPLGRSQDHTINLCFPFPDNPPLRRVSEHQHELPRRFIPFSPYGPPLIAPYPTFVAYFIRRGVYGTFSASPFLFLPIPPYPPSRVRDAR